MTQNYHGKKVWFISIPFIGHLNPLVQVAKGLNAEGIQSSIISYDSVLPYLEKNHPELNFISLGKSPLEENSFENFLEDISSSKSWFKSGIKLIKPLQDIWPYYFDGLDQIIKERGKPDLLIIDYPAAASFDIADKYEIPYIVNNADILNVLPANLIPYKKNVPLLMAPKPGSQMNFLDNFYTYIVRIIMIKIVAKTLSKKINKFRTERGLEVIDIINRLKEKPIFINSSFGLEYPQNIPSNMVMTGPLLPENNDEIEDDIKDWLEKGSPVIYVSLGTLSSPDKKQLIEIAEGLNIAGYRVLWVVRKVIQEKLPNLDEHFKVINWVKNPRSILAHPKVKLFVSHCGVNSINEAISCEKPILGIPMFAAQRDMGYRLLDSGAGLLVDKNEIKAETIRERASKLINNLSYKENAIKIKKSFENSGGLSFYLNYVKEFLGKN